MKTNYIYNKVLVKVFSYLLPLTSCLFMSCSDFLDILPMNSTVLENYWKEKADVTGAVNGCYEALASEDVVTRMGVWGELRSDNIVAGTNVPNHLNEMLRENLLPTNDMCKWSTVYNVINRCNIVCHYAPEVEEIDPNYTHNELKATIAEMKAIRALCYFYLIRAFRDVPYTTEPSIADDQNYVIPASKFDVIVDSLITDLESVKDDAQRRFELEKVQGKSIYVPAANNSRITRWAIYALLADLYLWKGDWDNVIRYCDMVIDYKKQVYDELLLMDQINDVEVYDVMDKDGSFLALFYCDFHPRASKKSGAWMTSFKEQWIEPDGTNSRPQVSIVMNLSKPTDNKPALLTLGEVETFLHEFGHSLHGIFANTTYKSLSGTNVYWDFVELPSQFMENFCIEKDFLNTFATHYQTEEPIPSTLIDRIVASRNFNVAYACMRQVSFGLLDMAFYTLTDAFNADLIDFERKAWSRAKVLPEIDGTCMTTQFSHIMAGGYSAGYYSYKWAEVLDADAFSLFKQQGIFNQKLAQRFRDCILSRGGTEHPMTLYKRFRGQMPTITALLERNGITSNKH